MEDTSTFMKMEDDLNFFENGRRPQFWEMEETSTWLACVHCHGTKCPLLTVCFLSLSLSPCVTFLTEGVIVGFRSLAGAPNLKKYYDSTPIKNVGTPSTP